MELINQSLAFLGTDVGIKILMAVGVVVLLLQIGPIMLWVERRGAALMQNRLGPNRVGPQGIFQAIADAVKFVFKEDRAPGQVNGFYYTLAPILIVIPAFMTFAVMPFASSLTLPSGREIVFQAAELNVGILYIFAIASLGVYGIILASWSSNSKYALFGGLRSAAQMISYELALGLSIVGLIMTFQSVELGEMARRQGEILVQLGPLAIPKWGILIQPVAFVIFVTAIFAETNRLPFDLPEGESEIVAGFHVEYGSMKFALFFMAEYVNMFVASALISTLFFGGWQLLPGMQLVLNAVPVEGMGREWLRILFEFMSLSIKTWFFMWFFVWVRWTVPRFRYDQVMNLGWRVLFPLSLANIFVTGLLIYYRVL